MSQSDAIQGMSRCSMSVTLETSCREEAHTLVRCGMTKRVILIEVHLQVIRAYGDDVMRV